MMDKIGRSTSWHAGSMQFTSGYAFARCK